MNVFIEYVTVITAWQIYTYTQQMHNNTLNRNTSQLKRPTYVCDVCPVTEGSSPGALTLSAHVR